MSLPIQPLAYELHRCDVCGHWWRQKPGTPASCPRCHGAALREVEPAPHDEDCWIACPHERPPS